MDFDANKKTIKAIFSTRNDVSYQLPLNQRPYVWSNEEVQNLLNDIYDEDDAHFIGAIVVNKEDFEQTKIKEIVDGQQRMLTITIIFSAIREYYKSLGDSGAAQRIQENYIDNVDDNGVTVSYKIITDPRVRSFFEKTILNKNPIVLAAITGEEKLIERNLGAVRTFINKKLIGATPQDNVEIINDLRDRLLNLLTVLVEVATEMDAFTFFESLNARSVDLTTADLLKNLFYKKLSGNPQITREDIEKTWKSIGNNLSYGFEQIDATRFVRHFWLSSKKKVSEKKLYGAIKTDTADYLHLLKTLEIESGLYKSITSPNETEWRGPEGKEIYRGLRNLSFLNVKQATSVLLSLVRLIRRPDYSTLKTVQVKKAFGWIEKFTFAFSTVSEKSPSKLETIYSRCGIKLSAAQNKSQVAAVLKQLHDDLKSNMPSKQEFKSGFIKNLQYSKESKHVVILRYAFEKINYQGSIGQKFDQVEIEHILPLNPEPAWGLTQEEIEGYVNSVGNLTILTPQENSDAGDLVISGKLPIYQGTLFQITKRLAIAFAADASWDLAKIRAREEVLAEEAWNYWNIS